MRARSPSKHPVSVGGLAALVATTLASATAHAAPSASTSAPAVAPAPVPAASRRPAGTATVVPAPGLVATPAASPSPAPSPNATPWPGPLPSGGATKPDAKTPPAPSEFHAHVFGGLGYTRASVEDSIAKAPMLLTWSVGATLAYAPLLPEADFGLGPTQLLLGATADYRYVGQYNAVDARIGNFRGTRINPISPTVGVIAGDLLATVDVQLLGKYELGNATAEGSNLTYAKPRGIRAMAMYRLGALVGRPGPGGLYGGLQFEYASFGTSTIEGVSTHELSPRQSLWQAGWVVSYAF